MHLCFFARHHRTRLEEAVSCSQGVLCVCLSTVVSQAAAAGRFLPWHLLGAQEPESLTEKPRYPQRSRVCPGPPVQARSSHAQLQRHGHIVAQCSLPAGPPCAMYRTPGTYTGFVVRGMDDVIDCKSNCGMLRSSHRSSLMSCRFMLVRRSEPCHCGIFSIAILACSVSSVLWRESSPLRQLFPVRIG